LMSIIREAPPNSTGGGKKKTRKKMEGRETAKKK